MQYVFDFIIITRNYYQDKMPKMGKTSCFSHKQVLITVYLKMMANTYIKSNQNTPPMTLILEHILFILH